MGLVAVDGDPFAASKPVPPPKGLTPVDHNPFMAEAPKEAPKLKPVSHNPFLQMGSDFIHETGERGRAADRQIAEGLHAGRDQSGTVTDPLAYAGGLGEAAMGAFGKVTAPIGAAAKVLSRPAYKLARSSDPEQRASEMGDFAENLAGFVVPGAEGLKGKAAEVPKEPLRPASESLETPRSAATHLTAPKLIPVAGDPFKSASAALERGKTKTMAEAPGTKDRELISPGPAGEGEPVVGGEADPVERLDNAFYRLGGRSTARRIELQDIIKKAPKELQAGLNSEDFYHALEAKLADPNAVMPPEFEAHAAYLKPLIERQRAVVNRLFARNDPEIDEKFAEDIGHVPRRAQGYTPGMDQALTPGSRDPILGKIGKGQSGLKASTGALKKRTAGFVTTDINGKTTFWKGQPPETDLMGRPYANVRQATTREIEANTDARYHKNALVNFVDDVDRLEQVEDNLAVLDELKENFKDEGKAVREYRFYRNDRGELVKAPGNEYDPQGAHKGWRKSTIPQLEGWRFPPEVADVLDKYRPDPEKPADFFDVLAKANRYMTAALFATPIPHGMNVGAHWYAGRGFDWVRPSGWRSLYKDGTRAAIEVLTMGPKYRQMLREGGGLLYGDTQTRNFQKLLMDKAASEFTEDPKAVSIFAKAAGLPVSAVKGWYGGVNKALWAINDVFMLQRYLELERKGMSARKAISEAEKDIPNYRVPAQVMKQPWLSKALRSPSVLMFGPYKYGQAKAYGEMFKDLFGKAGPADQKEALGKFLALVIGGTVAYPMLDAVARKATGNPNARVKRAGPYSVAEAAGRVAGVPDIKMHSGGPELTPDQRDMADVLSSFVSLGPALDKGIELARNKDYFGRDIRTPGAGADLQAAQAGMFAGESALYPVQLAAEAAKPGGMPAALGRLAGLELPSDRSVAGRAKAMARRKKTAAKATGRFRSRLGEGDYMDALFKGGNK